MKSRQPWLLAERVPRPRTAVQSRERMRHVHTPHLRQAAVSLWSPPLFGQQESVQTDLKGRTQCPLPGRMAKAKEPSGAKQTMEESAYRKKVRLQEAPAPQP